MSKGIKKISSGSKKVPGNAKKMENALGTMTREAKGLVIPPPILKGKLKKVADEISSWDNIISTTHWNPFDLTQVDGIDFYFGKEEVGHIHLNGEAHIATSPALGKELVEKGLAQPLVYIRGWVENSIHEIDSAAMIKLFRRNYDRLVNNKRIY